MSEGISIFVGIFKYFSLNIVQTSKFSLTTLLSRVVCTVNKFSLTTLLPRVYGQQVFLDKFSFASFVARVHKMLLNIYLTFRRPFACQNPRSVACILVKFSLAAVHTNKLSFSNSWHNKYC